MSTPGGTDPRRAFGAWLRARRLHLGLSLRAVGEAVGLSHVYVGEVERGKKLALSRFPQMARVLACTVEELNFAAGVCPHCGRQP